jgi:purine nucleosidase
VLEFAKDSEKYPLYALAGQMYSTVAFEAGYAFWDTVTTAYLERPDMYTTEEQQLLNVTTGNDQGNIYKDPSGHSVNVVVDIQVQKFYDYLFEKWTYLKS